MEEWEAKARSWLSALPNQQPPTATEIDGWLDSGQSSCLPNDLKLEPRELLHQRIISLHHDRWSPHSQVPPFPDPAPWQFQRTDLWMPVYKWLETLDVSDVVKAKDVNDWLAENAEVREKLFSRHSRYHLMHYIQKMHCKMLHKRGKLQTFDRLSTRRTLVKAVTTGVRREVIPTSIDRSTLSSFQYNEVLYLLLYCNTTLLSDYDNVELGKLSRRKDGGLFISLTGKNEALLRFELLTDLQNQLTILLSKQKENSRLEYTDSLSNEGTAMNPSVPHKESTDGTTTLKGEPLSLDDEKCSNETSFSHNVEKCSNFPLLNLSSVDTKDVKKRKREVAFMMPAWCNSQLFSGSQDEESILDCITNSQLQSKCSKVSLPGKYALTNKNIVTCLQGREPGYSWPLTCSSGGYVGKAREKWISFLEGWHLLGRQFKGPGVWCQRRCYSSWVPSRCSYTSNVAIAQPFARRNAILSSCLNYLRNQANIGKLNVQQGVQKVLDVRFHPEGLAQLVCRSNEPPNELLLYNLHSGRGFELTSHNYQIQAVEFAVKGASIVSCGANLVKIWDSTTGSCLFTFGRGDDAQASVGRVKKINAMTVNRWQSCFVATCGGLGDGKLLLWNALTRQLAADLNVTLRAENDVNPSIEVMEFCNHNLLACGTDSSHTSVATVQLWDIEASQSFQSLPANDSVLEMGRSVYLMLERAEKYRCSQLDQIMRYFHASSTSNTTLVWDTRLMPTNQRNGLKGYICDMTPSLKPLHCLSHGKQMPTPEHAGQLPGFCITTREEVHMPNGA